MARYRVVDRSPRFLPIVLDAQLMAGSFEYALDYLIDNEVDLSGIAKRYCNDETGAPAYDPGGSAQDRASGQQPRHRQQSGDRAPVPGKRAVHGDLGRQRPAVHDGGQIHA